MLLETERLVLRPPIEREVAALDPIYGNAEVTRYIDVFLGGVVPIRLYALDSAT